MFERYTERARRVVFFARYEASQFGCSLIDIDHLLLGLVREEKHLYRWVPKIDTTTLRKRIEDRITKAPSISTSIDLPLSAAARQTLANAATEADRLNHRYIGTHHLFLA